MDQRFYPGVVANVSQLVDELKDVFGPDYAVQTLLVATTTVIQARKSNMFLDLTGLSAALTVRITTGEDGTRVELGTQKWLDKAAVAAIAFVVMPPLLALPAIGAYGQYKVTERAWEAIDQHIARKGSA